MSSPECDVRPFFRTEPYAFRSCTLSIFPIFCIIVRSMCRFFASNNELFVCFRDFQLPLHYGRKSKDRTRQTNKCIATMRNMHSCILRLSIFLLSIAIAWRVNRQLCCDLSMRPHSNQSFHFVSCRKYVEISVHAVAAVVCVRHAAACTYHNWLPPSRNNFESLVFVHCTYPSTGPLLAPFA